MSLLVSAINANICDTNPVHPTVRAASHRHPSGVDVDVEAEDTTRCPPSMNIGKKGIFSFLISGPVGEFSLRI